MEFYTYTYIRRDGTPYYVGKGCKDRAFVQLNHYVKVPEPGRIQVQHWASEQEALEMEKWWIKLWGRKDNGTGILRNLTDGGDGMIGYRHTDATKAIIKAKRALQVTTDSTREKMRQTHKALGTTPPNLKGKSKSDAWKAKQALLDRSTPLKGNTYRLGKPVSQETRNKMSVSAKARRAREKANEICTGN